jgi:hypothetical protein
MVCPQPSTVPSQQCIDDHHGTVTSPLTQQPLNIIQALTQQINLNQIASTAEDIKPASDFKTAVARGEI